MRIPKWEKVDFEVNTQADAQKLISTLKIGELPLLLVIKEEDPKKVNLIIDWIHEILAHAKIDSNFPYPTYILSPYADPHLELNVIRSPYELPDHFWVKVKRLKGKEESLLKKTMVLAQKLKSHELLEKSDYVKHRFVMNRVLRDLTRETYYYETLLQQLNKE